jgi:hypothetical protein
MVVETVVDRFVPVQINTQNEAGKPVVERYRQAWTPDIRILDASGFEFSSWMGFLPPAEYVPQLLVSQAMAYLRLQNNERTAGIYQEVLDRSPTSLAAPEAAFFFAIARYKDSHEPADLRGIKGWKRLQTQYPQSVWRVKQSWTEGE